MPFKSKAQQRFMFAAEERGELPEGTARRWAKHTDSIKRLPEHVKKGSDMNLMDQLYFAGVNRYMDKVATEDLEAMYRVPAHQPRQETLAEKFMRAKHKHDPYFSTVLGGMGGAALGSTKGKLMGALGGGLGAAAGLSMARNKERIGG